LIKILREIGITGVYLDWFKTYLKDRKYKVKLSESYSGEKSCDYGIPQGSNLAPLLFIIYINKIFNIALKTRLYGYADDLLLIASHREWKMALEMLQLDFNKITKWMHDMDLVMNGEKTVMINIHLRNKKINYEPIIKYHNCSCPESTSPIGLVNTDSTCDCKKLEVVNDYEYLGIVLDEGLTWKNHINKIKKRLFSCTAALYKIKNVMNGEGKIAVYKSLVESIIRYGIITYGTAADCHMNKIYSIQKKTLEMLFEEEKLQNIDLFAVANTLTPWGFYKFYVIINYFNATEYRVRNNKSVTLRNVERFKVAFTKTEFGTRLPQHIVPKIYNSLPDHFINEQNYSKFKSMVYQWLVCGVQA